MAQLPRGQEQAACGRAGWEFAQLWQNGRAGDAGTLLFLEFEDGSPQPHIHQESRILIADANMA